MTIQYRRAKGATARRVGAALFLASAERGTLYRASSSVAAMWNLASNPVDAREAVAVFHAAFPALSLRRLRADVAMILRDLLSEGLLERVPPPRPRKRAARKPHRT